MKKHVLLGLIFILLSQSINYLLNCIPNAAASDKYCFDSIINGEERLEIYPGSFWATTDNYSKTYIKHKGTIPSLNDNNFELYNTPIFPSYDTLCDNNYIFVWDETVSSNLPTYVYGKILDNNFNIIKDKFRIEEEDEAQWYSLVKGITDRKFVVFWQRLLPGNEIPIYSAKIFENTGKPIGEPFRVSWGQVSRATAHGLPDGGFIVLWEHPGTKVWFRIFNENGSPRTDEISICENKPWINKICVERLQWPVTTHVKVFSSGIINIFMVHDNYLRQDLPIELARSYDSSGKALTEILDKKSALQLQGYQDVVEDIVYANVSRFDKDLRNYLNKDMMAVRDFCREYSLDEKYRGKKLLEWSKKDHLIDYIKNFHKKYKEICPKP